MPPSLTFPDPPTVPPALSRLFESNALPSSMESNLIAGYTEELESQIASVDEAAVFLSRRRTELLQSIRKVQTLRRPIHRLPPEILQEIFTFAVSAAFHFGDISEVAPPVYKFAPWLLTRVCHHWSTVALQTPTLWAMVFLSLDVLGQRGMVPLTDLLLARSRNVPLSVKVFSHTFENSPNPILDLAKSHSDRWRIVDLYMTVPRLNQFVTLRGHLSSLTTLLFSIDLAEEEETDLDAEFWDALAVTPNLRHLQAHSWNEFGFCPTPFTLAWDQLTQLSTTFTSNTEALSILGKLSAIVECKLAFTTTNSLPMASTTIRLPHLRSLALQIEDDDFPDTQTETVRQRPFLLDFLETPALQSLTVRETADETAVDALIARSNCAAFLTGLRFHSNSNNIAQDAMLRLVAKLPQLAWLEIADFNGTLLPRAMPTFIRTLASQWVAKELSGGPSRLTVGLVDHTYSPHGGGARPAEIERMKKDGLFVEISRISFFAGIIMEPLFEGF
ncbi:hypothetical protein B0H16DRAFT_1608818 [Mycena metata]|uniref:F-box domain-containing protein n=1 Tax=Mycena metata TaxID=1033252 RepID=A0AAD7HEQ0_9AGAR|nr:hypothetical protein B0H16DRAFT_1608818 [Mycena metata]